MIESKNSDVLKYILQKKLVHRTTPGQDGSTEYILSHCPFCNDNNFHLYWNEGGMYYCHKCGESGSFLTLKQKFGDIPTIMSFAELAPKEAFLPNLNRETELNHSALLQDKETLLYCHSRTFSREALDKLRIGLAVENGAKWLCYPYIKGDEVVNIKKRRIDKKEFRRIEGRPSILYNYNDAQTRAEYILVTEGEADAVALISQGFDHVVGATIGAQGIANEWVAQLDKFPKIIILYDNDDPGQEGAYKLAKRLGMQRCYRINLPDGVKDINEYFQKGGTFGSMAELIENCRRFEVQFVNSIGALVRKAMFQKTNPTEEKDKLAFPWERLNHLTGGLVAGDLVVVAAKPAVGKTTFTLNILYDLAKKNIPVLLYEMEMRPERILPRVLARHMGIDSKDVLMSDNLPKTYVELRDVPFYFAYMYKKPNFEQIADTIRNCVNQYGIKFVVFDNLHFLVRSTSDQTREVSVIVQSFKLLAEELEIPILTIARPRKNTGKIMSNVDLKDSADIEGDADNIIILHRDSKIREETDYQSLEGTFFPEMKVIVSKARYSAGGMVYMTMDDKTGTVTEKL